MKNLKKTLLTLFLTLTMGVSANAATNLDFGPMAQPQFDAVSQQAGTLITYRAMAPAEPGGWIGFDISVAASAVKIDSALWDSVIPTENITSDYVYVPSIRARKGLPLGFDIGASYSQVPGSDIQVLGGEVQWSWWDGSVATPAFAFRGHYSTLLNSDELNLTSYGADAVLSKGFAMFTPYVGIGAVAMESEYTGTLPANQTLQKFTDTSPRYFGGLRMTLALFQITADIEYLEEPVYSLKLGLGW